MGMGYLVPPPATAAGWNSGCCDVMAVALHRTYGLPLMASFERGMEGGAEALGYLVHAWVRLPDGRALDAGGPFPMPGTRDLTDPDDPWVDGIKVVEIADDDPHLLDVREETDYADAVRDMDAAGWAAGNLGALLSGLGIHPLPATDPAPSPGGP